MLHVYFGNGKGKTTAALGLLVRAAGCGNRCVLVQFLKDWNSGEIASLAALPNVTVFRGKASGHAFTRDMTEEQLAETREIHNENFKNAANLAVEFADDDGRANPAAKIDGGRANPAPTLLVLDELIDAVRLKLIDEDAVRDFLDAAPENLEIVITGHGAADWITERADYITEMVKRRHPYDKGVTARRGIEF